MIHMLQANENFLLNLGSAVVISAVMIVISFIALRIYTDQKSRMMLYFFFSWFVFGSFIIVSTLVAVVLESVVIFQLAYTFLFPLNTIFWFAFIDEAMNEKIGIKKMIFAFSVFSFIAAFVSTTSKVMAVFITARRTARWLRMLRGAKPASTLRAMYSWISSGEISATGRPAKQGKRCNLNSDEYSATAVGLSLNGATCVIQRSANSPNRTESGNETTSKNITSATDDP